jgi:parvulin-like peptidyl-prolyl isomerase
MMRSRARGSRCPRGLLPWFVLGLGLAGCRMHGDAPSSTEELRAIEKAPWASPERVIAEVNGRPITRGDYYQRILRRFGTARMLSGVIKEELFVQEAERRGITVSTRDVDARVREMVADMARDAGSEAELARIYAAEGVSLEDLRRDMGREASGQMLITLVVKSYRKVDDEILRRYYAETYKHTRRRTRHIAYSFLSRPGETEGDLNRRKLEALDKAARAADQIRKGGDFAAIARAESEDSVTASRGGELGFIHEDSPMDAAMKAKILSLAAGEVSDPVENSSGGYHVFQVTEVLPAQGFVEAKEAMRIEIQERAPELQEIEGVLRTLRERATVKVLLLPAVGDAEADEAASRPAETGSAAPVVPVVPAAPAASAGAVPAGAVPLVESPAPAVPGTSSVPSAPGLPSTPSSGTGSEESKTK